MKVPPLIINLKNIEKHDKEERADKHEKHEKHKKHRKHKKHKHKHHHHDHDHSSHHGHNKEHKEQKEPKDKPPIIKILNPPLLEPVMSESELLYPYQSTYDPPSLMPYPHVVHPVPTPPSQIELREKEKQEAEAAAASASQGSEFQPPVLEDKVISEPTEDSKQSDDNERVTEPPATLDEAPKSADSLANDLTQKDDPITQGTSSAPEPMASPAKLLPSLELVHQNSTPELSLTKAQEPNSQMSYLKMSEDGTVRLNILAPIRQADESNEKILNLEQVCGQLQDGLDVIPSDINEDDCKEQLQVNPVGFVETPTFGSHLPMKDSTFANLTKEDSETLLEVYGGNATTYEYAESLQNYASGTNYLMKMVDSLLDLLTEGKHNKEAVPIRQKLIEVRREEAKRNEVAAATVVAAAHSPTQNGTSTLKIGDEIHQVTNNSGVEDEVEKMDVDQNGSEMEQESNEVQQQLNEIDNLLADLRELQEQRLSSSPAPVEPDEAETKLADEVLSKMTKLIKEKAKPSEICESSSILKALGIPLDAQS